METTKKSRKKPASKSEQSILHSYIDNVLKNGKQPSSVYAFCRELGIPEPSFYQHYSSFDSIDRLIWRQIITSTIKRLDADASFQSFAVREKVLAFYYTLLEEMKQQRSILLYHLKNTRKLELTPAFLKDFKAEFEQWISTRLAEGKASGEIASRPYLDKQYNHLFWMHFGFLLVFWKEDNSAAFEQTDVAVEKSVNLAFDLVGKGAVDTALDFAKFIYQNRKN